MKYNAKLLTVMVASIFVSTCSFAGNVKSDKRLTEDEGKPVLENFFEAFKNIFGETPEQATKEKTDRLESLTEQLGGTVRPMDLNDISADPSLQDEPELSDALGSYSSQEPATNSERLRASIAED